MEDAVFQCTFVNPFKPFSPFSKFNTMTDAIFSVPQPVNEPVWNYAPGSPEKLALKKALAEAKATRKDIPM